ncbi:hypothetical protein QMK19_05600 [Streptomyces sp. H10-C2]|uniref:hypothetical protein n=1 Tax=unclassified Streptomyces TaxID=2593676 RepID=UPI0024BA05A2|nr:MULTISPECIES: hypothetical protein [unclassified Streptomyces]MDJ0341513.1 hypothetical protein [Streptomyces sp. PH10-H1]MDJ0369170.1 hypothetical protein [Streptomyces sp. H10-C2]
MKDRSLKALGLAEVAATQPLIYPGRPVAESALLHGDELLRLEPLDDRPGAWPVIDGGRITLDKLLAEIGQPTVDHRVPVLAVGSNASPGQVSHKLTRLGLPAVVPMVPVRVGGIGVGVSGHISPAGYVAASPYLDPATESVLVVTWLDPAQLAAVDATEIPDYRRILIDGDEHAMTLPSGEQLPSAYLYINVNGVLATPDGAPRPAQEQRSLLSGLLASSERLREMFGPDPETWITRAGADPRLRAAGTRVFAEEGWVLRQKELLNHAPAGTDPAPVTS